MMGHSGLVPYLSARKRHQDMDVWFELSGGVQRLVHITDKSDENYLQVLKVWAKGLPRVAGVEHTAESSIEDLIEARDKAMGVIEGECTEIKDAPE